MLVEIPEFPDYQIDKEGNIYSTKSNKFLSTYIDRCGYIRVGLYLENKQYQLYVHRILARVYKGLPSLYSELEVDHKDTNKLNIDLDNLTVCTYEEYRLKTTLERGQTPLASRLCVDCSTQISETATRCRSCSDNKRTINVLLEDIEYWVTNFSWLRAAKELGMSNSGIRGKYKKLSGKDPKELTKR